LSGYNTLKRVKIRQNSMLNCRQIVKGLVGHMYLSTSIIKQFNVFKHTHLFIYML